MISIIPAVKEMKIKDGFFTKTAIYYNDLDCDVRILNALKKLPYDENGAKLSIIVDKAEGEGYELILDTDNIDIKANGAAGAFYAIQTLRQILKHSEIPCLEIKDSPDFEYRGFYHDVTRGKVPTVKTIKSLIDEMSYYKLNSLQLYVEHTFEFDEYADVIKNTGYLTKAEMKEIGDYCKENFIEFIPSLSTFGHLFELLNQPKYQHLRTIKDYVQMTNFWRARMLHHTIDPLNRESIEVIKSLISQYVPIFESEYFNICCDETFDLNLCYENQGYDVGKMYVDFVKEIIDYVVTAKNKKVMMWADILLKYPETIDSLPEDICFLNWNYRAEPSEEKIEKFATLGRKQIVCPGTSSWSRLCEDVTKEEKNISLMAEYGYKHGAIGVLNTNWGDWGNPCSIELAMYGMVLGAEKSWSVKTEVNNEFYDKINFILFENENGIQYLKELSKMHEALSWNGFCSEYFNYRNGTDVDKRECLKGEITDIQNDYKAFAEKLSAEKWKNDEYREEMLISAEGICLLSELYCKMTGREVSRITNADKWLEKFKAKWRAKNKESEVRNIEEMLTYCENN